MWRPLSVLMLLAFDGCAVPVDVGGCGPLRITEVLSSGEALPEPLPWTDKKMDFVELRNTAPPDSAEVVQVEGFQVSLNGSGVEAPLPPLLLEPGDRAVLVASNYRVSDTFEIDPEVPGVPWTGIGLDMNNDLSAIDLVAPDGSVCQPLVLPDQHAGWSMSAKEDPVGRIFWCGTEPTPGLENGPCLDR